MSVIIRKADFYDYEGLSAIFRQCNDEHLAMRPDLYRKVAEPVPKLKFMLGVAARHVGYEPATIFVADGAGELAGAVHIESLKRSALSWSAFEKEAHIDNLVVMPAYRNFGIATKLAQAAIGWAVETGHTHVTGKILAVNKESLNLAEKAGFQQDSINVGWHLKK